VEARQGQQNLLRQLHGAQLTLTRMMSQIRARHRFSISNMARMTQLLPGIASVYDSILNRMKNILLSGTPPYIQLCSQSFSISATPLIRPPRLIRPDFCGLLVTGLTAFHLRLSCYYLSSLKIKPVNLC